MVKIIIHALKMYATFQNEMIGKKYILCQTVTRVFNILINPMTPNSSGYIIKQISIIIIILLEQDYKKQLANNKIQMAWLTSLVAVG